MAGKITKHHQTVQSILSWDIPSHTQEMPGNIKQKGHEPLNMLELCQKFQKRRAILENAKAEMSDCENQIRNGRRCRTTQSARLPILSKDQVITQKTSKKTNIVQAKRGSPRKTTYSFSEGKRKKGKEIMADRGSRDSTCLYTSRHKNRGRMTEKNNEYLNGSLMNLPPLNTRNMNKSPPIMQASFHLSAFPVTEEIIKLQQYMDEVRISCQKEIDEARKLFEEKQRNAVKSVLLKD